MRVLAGGPTRETASGVFGLHVEGLRAQGDVEVSHVVVPPVVDPALEFEGGPGRWQAEGIRRVAGCRQSFMERAGVAWFSRFDDDQDPEALGALLMVDSDVILGPGVLDRMWAVDAPVVYGVFWTVWPGMDHPLPQVWDIHPYGHTEGCLGALLDAPSQVEVAGGGACTLIRGRGFESHYAPLLRGLERSGGMWGGEDRTYCVGLEARGIKQVAVTGLPIVHLYRPEQQTDEALEEARRMVGL